MSWHDWTFWLSIGVIKWATCLDLGLFLTVTGDCSCLVVSDFWFSIGFVSGYLTRPTFCSFIHTSQKRLHCPQNAKRISMNMPHHSCTLQCYLWFLWLKLAQKVREKVAERKTVVSKIAEIIKSNYSSFPDEHLVQVCCDVDDSQRLPYLSRLRAKV